MQILGGRSANRRISIFSEEFTATAYCDQDGNITSETYPRSPPPEFFHRHEYLQHLIPRSFLFLFRGIKTKTKTILGIVILSLVLTDIYACVNTEPAQTVPHFLSNQWIATVSMLTITAILLLRVSKKIATWHGAEHMAIAAYMRNGSTEIESISKECPVIEICGGRLLIPSLLAIIVADFITKITWISFVTPALAAIECVLRVEELKGFHKIPGFSHASEILQKYITTRKPGMQELLTAQRALQELVKAHNPTQS